MNYKKVFKNIIMIILAFLLFYPPFLRGLFFKPEMYFTHVVSFILFIVFMIYKWINKDYKIIKYKLEYTLGLLVIAYLVPILFHQSASLKYSVEYLLRYFNYFLVYIMVRDMIDSKKDYILFLNVIIISSITLCILGIDSAIGEHILKSISQMLSLIGVKYSFFSGFAEGRIYSTYQYPNVLASALAASYILVLSFVLYNNNKYIKALYASLGFILLSTFILTLSRGMYLVLPIAITTYLVLLKDKEKIIESVLTIFITGIISVAFAALFQKFYSVSGNVVWISLISLFAVCYGLFLVILRGSNKLLNVNNKIYYVTIGLLIALGVSYLILALNMEKPLVLIKGSQAVRDISGIVPNNKYKIKFNLNSNDIKDSKYVVMVQGVNRFLEVSDILSFSDGLSKNNKTLEFNSLADTYSLKITFKNQGKNNINVSDFRLINVSNSKVRRIGLDYLLMPYEFVSKIKDISISTHNAWQRLTFMRDALNVVGDHGLLGLGGGAWRVVYYNYQSYNYSTTEVHSFPLQLWIESGILGVISFFGFIVLFVYYFKGSQNNKNEDNIFIIAIFVSVLLMVLHSFIDFDFSLSAIVFLLYELVAVFSYLILNQNRKTIIKSKYERTKFLSLLIIVIVATIYVVPAFSATRISSKIKKYYDNHGTIDLKQNGDAVATFLEHELSKDRFETKNREQLIRVCEQLSKLNLFMAQNESDEYKSNQYITKSQEYLIKAKNNIYTDLDYERESTTVLLNASAFYINNGYNLGILSNEGYKYLEKGLQLVELANKKAKYQIPIYIQRAEAYLAVGEFMMTDAGRKNDINLFNEGITILNKIDNVKNDFKDASKTSLKPVNEPIELDEIIKKKNTFMEER